VAIVLGPKVDEGVAHGLPVDLDHQPLILVLRCHQLRQRLTHCFAARQTFRGRQQVDLIMLDAPGPDPVDEIRVLHTADGAEGKPFDGGHF